MLDSEDVVTVISLFEEKVGDPMDDLIEALEEHHLADEGEIEDGKNLEEGFEDLSSADQKDVEKALRTAVIKISKGIKEVAAELKAIDNEILGEEEEEDEDEDEEDDDDV